MTILLFCFLFAATSCEEPLQKVKTLLQYSVTEKKKQASNSDGNGLSHFLESRSKDAYLGNDTEIQVNCLPLFPEY